MKIFIKSCYFLILGCMSFCIQEDFDVLFDSEEKSEGITSGFLKVCTEGKDRTDSCSFVSNNGNFEKVARIACRSQGFYGGTQCQRKKIISPERVLHFECHGYESRLQDCQFAYSSRTAVKSLSNDTHPINFNMLREDSLRVNNSKVKKSNMLNDDEQVMIEDLSTEDSYLMGHNSLFRKEDELTGFGEEREVDQTNQIFAICATCYETDDHLRKIRLTNDHKDVTIQMFGTVQIWLDGKWKGICSKAFDYKASIVACRQLGLKYAKKKISPTNMVQSDQPMMSVECKGDEATLQECHLSNAACSSPFAASLVCAIDNDVLLYAGFPVLKYSHSKCLPVSGLEIFNFQSLHTSLTIELILESNEVKTQKTKHKRSVSNKYDLGIKFSDGFRQNNIISSRISNVKNKILQLHKRMAGNLKTDNFDLNETKTVTQVNDYVSSSFNLDLTEFTNISFQTPQNVNLTNSKDKFLESKDKNLSSINTEESLMDETPLLLETVDTEQLEQISFKLQLGRLDEKNDLYTLSFCQNYSCQQLIFNVNNHKDYTEWHTFSLLFNQSNIILKLLNQSNDFYISLLTFNFQSSNISEIGKHWFVKNICFSGHKEENLVQVNRNLNINRCYLREEELSLVTSCFNSSDEDHSMQTCSYCGCCYNPTLDIQCHLPFHGQVNQNSINCLHHAKDTFGEISFSYKKPSCANMLINMFLTIDNIPPNVHITPRGNKRSLEFISNKENHYTSEWDTVYHQHGSYEVIVDVSLNIIQNIALHIGTIFVDSGTPILYLIEDNYLKFEGDDVQFFVLYESFYSAKNLLFKIDGEDVQLNWQPSNNTNTSYLAYHASHIFHESGDYLIELSIDLACQKGVERRMHLAVESRPSLSDAIAVPTIIVLQQDQPLTSNIVLQLKRCSRNLLVEWSMDEGLTWCGMKRMGAFDGYNLNASSIMHILENNVNNEEGSDLKSQKNMFDVLAVIHVEIAGVYSILFRMTDVDWPQQVLEVKSVVTVTCIADFYIIGAGRTKGEAIKVPPDSKILFSAQLNQTCNTAEAVGLDWAIYFIGNDDINEDWIQLKESNFKTSAFVAFLNTSQLQEGFYVISLEITINLRNKPAIIEKRQAWIYITQQPLVVVVKGGLTHVIDLNSQVVIDASESYDPSDIHDKNIDDQKLKFNWTCYRDHCGPFDVDNLPCFHPGYEPQKNLSYLSFNSDDLMLEKKSYMFTLVLKVTKEGRKLQTAVIRIIVKKKGNDFNSSNQLLNVNNRGLQIMCIKNCKEEEYEFKPIELKAMCVGCREQKSHFVWDIEYDRDSNTSHPFMQDTAKSAVDWDLIAPETGNKDSVIRLFPNAIASTSDHVNIKLSDGNSTAKYPLKVKKSNSSLLRDSRSYSIHPTFLSSARHILLCLLLIQIIKNI